MKRGGLILGLLVAACVGRAESPALLNTALQGWIDGRDAWAFTQHIREYDDDRVREERVERYDPSLPQGRRWVLLQVNGRAPTAAELATFLERKNRRKRRPIAPADYIDFGHVAVATESAGQVRYAVPLRSDASWLVPVEKLAVAVTVNKDQQCLEHVTAELREPFRIAFGLARVTDLSFDLRFASDGRRAALLPAGTARMTLFKFGNRAEFAWTDFRRVNP